MPDSNLYFAIDFGSSKIKSILAKKDANGRIEVLSIDEIASKGVLRGSIMNPSSAALQVSNLVKVVENNRAMTNLKVDKAYSGFGGFSMTSSVLTMPFEYPQNTRLSKELLGQMKEEVEKKMKDENLSSFMTTELEFKIDGLDCDAPLDYEGKSIVSRFLNIHGTQNLDMKVADALPRVSVKSAGLFVSPLEMAYCATSPKDREIGCAVVDFGHSTTSVVVFYNNKVRHVGVIPFGSNSITDDLTALKLTKMQAERIKIKYGAVHSDQKTQIINLNSDYESIQLDTYDLNKRIDARVDEIMDQVCGEIDKSGCYQKICNGIVLAGGGSKLNGLREFVEFKSGMEARYADWSHVLKEDTPEGFIRPEYAVLYGLVLKASENCTVSKGVPGEVIPPTPVRPDDSHTKKKKSKNGILGMVGKVGNLFFNDAEDGFGE